ncbi:MAG: hypothetical protein AB7S77_20135 [Desulfatirhabdiaceae bacterium]
MTSKTTTKEQQKQKKPKQDIEEPSFKISEVILDLCEPYLRKYNNPNQIKGIIHIAIMAWNVSLLPESDQVSMQERIIENHPSILSAEDTATFLNFFDELIVRKNKLYPNIREYILKHDVSFENGHVNLGVGSTPVPDELKKVR